MNIKITERAGGLWSIWVTEKPGDAEPPIFTATNRSREQVEALLPVILAMGPTPQPTVISGTPTIVQGHEGHELTPSGRAVASLALYHMMTVLDGWIEAAQSNHRAMEHRNENIGEECWRQIEPADVRTMVNDVARELGVAEFPTPEVAREDAR